MLEQIHESEDRNIGINLDSGKEEQGLHKTLLIPLHVSYCKYSNLLRTDVLSLVATNEPVS